MPFANHLRVSISGELRAYGAGGGAIEQFSLRVNMSDPGVTGSASFDQGRFDDIVQDCIAFWQRPASLIHPAAVMTQVKFAQIGPDGKYRSEPFVAGPVTGGYGSAAGHTLPLQTALAVSLVTARRGATGRGRFYLPIPTVTLENDATITAANAESVRGSVVTWLNALNNVPGFDGVAPKVVVASSKGYNSDVTGVRVGQVLDTIQSRRQALAEQYTAVQNLA